MRLSDWAWVAVGLVLIFAVSTHLAGFDVRLAGLILVARGAAGAWTGAGRSAAIERPVARQMFEPR